MTDMTVERLLLSTALFVLVACGGASSEPAGTGTGSASKTPGATDAKGGTAAPSNATLDGSWDVSAFTDLLASGKTGSLTVKGGHIAAELAMEPANGPQVEGCEVKERRLVVAVELAAGKGSGTMKVENKSEGSACEGAPGAFAAEGDPMALALKRSGGTGDALDGKWNVDAVVAGQTQETFSITVAGGKITVDVGGSTLVSANVADGKASATAQDFEFAARRR